MGCYVDFSPSGPRPPSIPGLAVRWDFSAIWRAEAHVRFYDYFGRPSWTAWVWPDGTSAEWAILGGDFLMDVRNQSQLVNVQQREAIRARGLARQCCRELRDCTYVIFKDRGYELINSDLSATNVLLSMGRFSCYWEVEGLVGPRRPHPDGGWTAFWRATIKWTVYDYYDFEWWTIAGTIPAFWTGGHPFHVIGTWNTTTGGVVRCPMPEPEDDSGTGTTGGSGTSSGERYILQGEIILVNDCDDRPDSLPNRVRIGARLENDQAGVDAQGEAEVGVDPASSDETRKVGTYRMEVDWDPANGVPTRWRTPKITRPDGQEVCGVLICERGRCADMVTRPRWVPAGGPSTTLEIRIVCQCLRS